MTCQSPIIVQPYLTVSMTVTDEKLARSHIRNGETQLLICDQQHVRAANELANEETSLAQAHTFSYLQSRVRWV